MRTSTLTRSLAAAALALLALDPAPANAQALSLQRALDAAHDNNPTLEAARQAEAAAATLRDTARALWRPNVEVTAAYTFFYDEATMEIGNPLAPLEPYLQTVAAQNPALPDPTLITRAPGISETVRHQHDVRADVTVSQPIWQPYAASTHALADAAASEAAAGVDLTRDRIDEAVISLFFGAARAQRLVDVRAELSASAALDLMRAERALEAGVGDAFTVTRARVALSSAQRGEASARAELAIALDALGDLTGVDTSEGVDGGDTDVDSAPSQAAPPEVRLSEAGASRFDATARTERAGAVPILLARANASAQREAAFGGDALQWNLQLVASWSLWDGGARAAAARRAHANAEELRLRAEQAAIDHDGELRRVNIRIQQLEVEVASAGEEAALASEAAERLNLALEAGVASWVDVEAARQQQALSSLALADAEVRLAEQRAQRERIATR